MNQCSRNRSRHPAVHALQLGERVHCRRVTQHAGNRAALLAALGFPLGAGFGLGHGRLPLGRLVRADAFGVALGHRHVRPAANGHAANRDEKRAIGLLRNGDGAVVPINLCGLVHGWLLSCVGPSSHVTSDGTTTVHRMERAA